MQLQRLSFTFGMQEYPVTYLKVWCEGLNRSHGFIFLSAWPRGSGTISSCGLVGVGALKEMCYYVDRF